MGRDEERGSERGSEHGSERCSERGREPGSDRETRRDARTRAAIEAYRRTLRNESADRSDSADADGASGARGVSGSQNDRTLSEADARLMADRPPHWDAPARSRRSRGGHEVARPGDDAR